MWFTTVTGEFSTRIHPEYSFYYHLNILEILWKAKIRRAMIAIPFGYSWRVSTWWKPFQNYRYCNETPSAIREISLPLIENHQPIIFPSKIFKDLNKCVVRIAPVIWEPYVLNQKVMTVKEGMMFEDGLDIRILKAVKSKLNFSGSFVYEQTMSWPEAAEMTEKGDVDLTVGAYLLEQQYLDTLDASVCYWQEAIRWFVPVPGFLPKWKSFTLVFRTELWVCLIVTVGGAWCAMIVSEREHAPLVASVDAILETGWAIGLHPFWQEYLNVSGDDRYHEVSRRSEACESPLPCLERAARRGDMAVAIDASFVAYNVPSPDASRLSSLPDAVSSQFLTMYVSRRAPSALAPALDFVVSSLGEAGILLHWWDELTRKKEVGELDGHPVPLTFSHIQGAFYLCALGLVAAAAVFVGEVVKERTKRRNEVLVYLYPNHQSKRDRVTEELSRKLLFFK